MPSLTVDLARSDVHIELVGGEAPGGGTLTIGGRVSGEPATQLSGTRRHVVLLKGGTGIRVLDRGARR